MVVQKIMEMNSSKLLDYIRVYDDVLSKPTLDVFLKICGENVNFSDAGLASRENDNPINKEIRDVKSWPLFNIGPESRTEVFWCNYFTFTFRKFIQKYNKSIGNPELGFILKDIEVLKYEKNGKYKFHVDHGSYSPRTFSCIYLCNSNYDGGELCFKFLGEEEELIIEKKSNRMIVWPSNFLYPHAVKPVTKGIRYSIVSWAL